MRMRQSPVPHSAPRMKGPPEGKTGLRLPETTCGPQRVTLTRLAAKGKITHEEGQEIAL